MIVEDELLIFAQICTNVFNEQISVSSSEGEKREKWQKCHFCSIKTLIFVNILVSNTLLMFEISKLRAWKALWIIKTNENCKFNFSHLWMKILKMNQCDRARFWPIKSKVSWFFCLSTPLWKSLCQWRLTTKTNGENYFLVILVGRL